MAAGLQRKSYTGIAIARTAVLVSSPRKTIDTLSPIKALNFCFLLERCIAKRWKKTTAWVKTKHKITIETYLSQTDMKAPLKVTNRECTRAVKGDACAMIYLFTAKYSGRYQCFAGSIPG